MTFSPLILRGNLKIGADSGSAVDVSDQVTGITIKGEVDIVEIPATLSTVKAARGGGAAFSIDLAYMADDVDGTLFDLLWDAITTPDSDKTLYFEGNLRTGATSATNPKWSGNFIVASAAVGGDADGLSTSNGTFPLTGAPTKALA